MRSSSSSACSIAGGKEGGRAGRAALSEPEPSAQWCPCKSQQTADKTLNLASPPTTAAGKVDNTQDTKAKLFPKFTTTHRESLSIQDSLIKPVASHPAYITYFSSSLCHHLYVILSFMQELSNAFQFTFESTFQKGSFDLSEGERRETDNSEGRKRVLPPYITVPVWLNTTRHWSRAGTVCNRWKVRRSHWEGSGQGKRLFIYFFKKNYFIHNFLSNNLVGILKYCFPPHPPACPPLLVLMF